MNQEIDDKNVDMEDYMKKSLRFCAAKCFENRDIAFATPASLSTIQDLLIQYIKEIGTKARNCKLKDQQYKQKHNENDNNNNGSNNDETKEKEGEKEDNEEKEEKGKKEDKEDEDDDDDEITQQRKLSHGKDVKYIVYSMENLMTPVPWSNVSEGTTTTMISGWRQDHHCDEYRIRNYVHRVINNSKGVREPYKPMSEYVDAQEAAINEAEKQVDVAGRRFKHKFPHTPQFPPPITYGTIPGSLKRAETATLLAERPKKKSKTKRSEKKSKSSSGKDKSSKEKNSKDNKENSSGNDVVTQSNDVAATKYTDGGAVIKVKEEEFTQN